MNSDAMQVFVVHDTRPDRGQCYVFDNHDAALKCRRELKLDHSHLIGCTISQDWVDGGPIRSIERLREALIKISQLKMSNSSRPPYYQRIRELAKNALNDKRSTP